MRTGETFHPRRIARLFPAGEPRTVPWYTCYRIFAVGAQLVRPPERDARPLGPRRSFVYLSNPSPNQGFACRSAHQASLASRRRRRASRRRAPTWSHSAARAAAPASRRAPACELAYSNRDPPRPRTAAHRPRPLPHRRHTPARRDARDVRPVAAPAPSARRLARRARCALLPQTLAHAAPAPDATCACTIPS